MRPLTVSLVVVALFAPAAIADSKFTLDGTNTKLEFTGTKADGKHDGGFKQVSGTATAGADPTTLKISLDIATDSLYSDVDKLTAHLKSPDFFNVKKYPRAKFVTTRVAKSNAGYLITGDLTLLGKTKSITVPAKVNLAGGKLELASSFKIDRTDWGMTFGKGKVDDAVTLRVSINAK
jgi:polyisoprenoid-binding protein YceI